MKGEQVNRPTNVYVYNNNNNNNKNNNNNNKYQTDIDIFAIYIKNVKAQIASSIIQETFSFLSFPEQEESLLQNLHFLHDEDVFRSKSFKIIFRIFFKKR